MSDQNLFMRPHTQILVHQVPLSALVDSGAVISAISEQAFARIPSPPQGPFQPDVPLVGAGNTPLMTLGKYFFDVILEPNSPQERKLVGWPMVVIRSLESDVILGNDILREAEATIDMASGQINFGICTKLPRSLSTISHPVISSHNLPPSCLTAKLAQRRTLQPEIPTRVQLTLECPPALTVRPGATVASWSTQINENRILNLDAIQTVQNEAKVHSWWMNLTPTPIHLEIGDRVPGIFFQQILPDDISPAINIMQCQPISILTEVDEALCPSQKPSMTSLGKQKRDFLLSTLELTPIEKTFQRAYKDFILTNHDVFSESSLDVGRARKFRHQIDLKTKTPQFRMQFKLSPQQERFLTDTVDDLLSAKAITPCRSPYNAPVFTVPKPSGHGLRLVQDLRMLNEASLDDRFSVMDTKSCLNKIGGNKPTVFSSLDLSASFWQLGLAEESKKTTAFTLPFQNKQFMWQVLPMGCLGASASFSRLMGEILGGIDGITVYVDDALCATPCHRSHLRTLEAVATKLRQYNLKLNPAKCILGRRQVTFLGHTVDSTGISPANDKIEALKLIPPPTSMAELYQSIGLFNFFRGLLPQFANRMAPLHRLTRKDSRWIKGPLPYDAKLAFITMRDALARGPILRYPDYNRPFALFVDAAGGANLSDTDKGGIGALLAQPTKAGQFAPVAYFSRALKGSERKYSAFDLEYLALTEALKYFQDMIGGQKTICYTDHKPLSDACKASASKTSVRLTDLLQNFDIEIQYKKGKENGAADALSRCPRPEAIAIIDPKFFPKPPKSNPDLPELQSKDPFITLVAQTKTGTCKTVDHPLLPLARNVAPLSFQSDKIWWIAGTKALTDTKIRTLAPLSMTNQIITSAHSSPLAGHWAKERTLQHVMQGWWWPTIAQDVSDYVSTCTECQHSKGSINRNLHQIQPWPPARRFNERVHVDLVGPLISSVGTGRYIMAAVDAFTRWTMLQILPCKTAQAARNAFFQGWVCCWSAPEVIISDNGKEFDNQLWKQLADGVGSKLHYITSYHPQANGLVERFNQDLKSYMCTLVSDDTKDWENFVPTLQLAKNCSWNRHTKTSPFEALTATIPNVPWSKPQTMENHRPTLPEIMTARKFLIANDQEGRQAYERYYNQTHKKDYTFQAGDKVLVHYPCTQDARNRKFHKPWKGPAMVIKALGHGTYEIQEPHKTDGSHSKLHRNRLKPFHETDRLQPNTTVAHTTRTVIGNTDLYLLGEALSQQGPHSHPQENNAALRDEPPLGQDPPQPIDPVEPSDTTSPAENFHTPEQFTADASDSRDNTISADPISAHSANSPNIMRHGFTNILSRIASSQQATSTSQSVNRELFPPQSLNTTSSTPPTLTITPPTREQKPRSAKRRGIFGKDGRFHHY